MGRRGSGRSSDRTIILEAWKELRSELAQRLVRVTLLPLQPELQPLAIILEAWRGKGHGRRCIVLRSHGPRYHTLPLHIMRTPHGKG